MSSSLTRVVLSSSLAVAALFGGAQAPAQVMLGQTLKEPNGWPIPQPASPPEVACCVTGRGYPASAAELDGLFKFRQDPNVNWITDAKTGPGVFSPLCGFSGTLVLRGGSCKLDFGWYNVKPGGGAPTDAEIYTLIPKNDPEVYGAGGGVDFCPLAGMTTNTGEQNKCTVKTFRSEGIRSDPKYAGGLIAFALRGDPNSTCKETHYSQNELHAPCMSNNASFPCANNSPWIMSLIYESKAFPDSYYLAFEDRPGSNSVFGTGMNDSDGDFNDFVFYISGVTCEGGGQPCDASVTNPNLKGVCAVGRTGCTAGGNGQAVCVPTTTPTSEKCDNIDNDCNGIVDDGKLCKDNEVCDRGTCVSACNTGEFQCSGATTCDMKGYCVDPLCKDKECPAGQVCRAGTCTGGCSGVICPSGQECQLGRCVDLCKNVTCDANQVCDKGSCIASCGCRPCLSGKACSKTSGKCVETGCETVTCAEGTTCVAGGQCKDNCEGVLCPGAAKCSMGQCGEPVPGAGPGPGAGGGPSIGSGGFSLAMGGNTSTAGGGGRTGSGRARGEPAGCGCRVAPERARSFEALSGLALGLLLLRRVRGRRRAA